MVPPDEFPLCTGAGVCIAGSEAAGVVCVN